MSINLTKAIYPQRINYIICYIFLKQIITLSTYILQNVSWLRATLWLFNKATRIKFYKFLKINKENIGIWSTTCNISSPHILYAAWKRRFTKMWKNEGRNRIGRYFLHMLLLRAIMLTLLR